MRKATNEEIQALLFRTPFEDGTLELFFAGLEDPFMAEAKRGIVSSSEKSHPTSAIIVKDGKILSTGSNQTGYKNPLMRFLHAKFPERFCRRKILKVPSGQGYHLCRGCAKPEDHAESRAGAMLLGTHGKVEGSTLYLYGHWWCCEPCCQAMVSAGVRKVVLLEGASRMFK